MSSLSYSVRIEAGEGEGDITRSGYLPSGSFSSGAEGLVETFHAVIFGVISNFQERFSQGSYEERKIYLNRTGNQNFQFD